jgi:hypothetical protein
MAGASPVGLLDSLLAMNRPEKKVSAACSCVVFAHRVVRRGRLRAALRRRRFGAFGWPVAAGHRLG